MYAHNFFIALFDAANNALSYPYYADEVETETLKIPTKWYPMGTGQARGVTAFVLRTGVTQHVDPGRCSC